jgi:multidrug efflux pump
VTIALLASWVVAILLSPVIGVYLLPKQFNKKHRISGLFTRIFRGMLLLSLRHSYFVIAATVVMFACSVWGATHLQRQFFPASDRPELVLSISLPQNASIYGTQDTVEQIEKLLSEDPDVEHWTFYVGSGPVRFYLP